MIDGASGRNIEEHYTAGFHRQLFYITTREEAKAMKFLFVDDNAEMLGSLRRALFNNKNVAFAECHSVEDALRTIVAYQPDVIFLDHHLTDDSN